MNKITLKEVQKLLNEQIDLSTSWFNIMIKDDPDNTALYRAVLRNKDTQEDINNIFQDLIELAND